MQNNFLVAVPLLRRNGIQADVAADSFHLETSMASPFAATMFLAAMLLFSIQPMIAKDILPKFGDSLAVWSTCVVFFQAMLLVGYSNAHVNLQLLGFRRQVFMHIAVWLWAC